MSFTRLISIVTAIVIASTIFFGAAPLSAQDHAAVNHGRGRIVILMIWDGLRPDLVTQRDTPNLFRMAHEGVRFERHHSIFPTLTMVNATALATGAPPGVNGLEGNVFYLAADSLPAPAASVVADGSPVSSAEPGNSQPVVARENSTISKVTKGQMISAEGARAIVDLNGPSGFKGRLIGLDTIAQEVAREGGYIAVVGKQGPTAVFDNRVESVVDGKDSLGQPHQDYLFASDDLAEPAAEAEKIKSAMPPETTSGVHDSQRDLYFARLVAENAMPAAKRAAEAGRPSLIVFWQHNPDLTQHLAGLGTMPAMEALTLCDDNLMRVRATIDSLGIGDRTDLIVVSDHGFATIKFRIVLSEMLVSAGIKKSRDSSDIIVAPNGGADLIYLSRSDFPTVEARRVMLQKIVDFAEAQEWCGPIFSREPAAPVEESSKRGRGRRASKAYLGWIDGTFSQQVIGLYNAVRSPDLVISFREEPNAENKGLTGPDNPAFLIGQIGQVSTRNKSAELVHPVRGTMYADTGIGTTFTTGMGMHGAAGEREIHNFCAAAGPDFRRGYVDFNPTANIDVAPTITEILGILPNIGPGGIVATGRPLVEALVDGGHPGSGAHTQTMTASLTLQGVEAVSTIHVTFVADEAYLDGATVEHRPLGSSP
jgi:arylsulfatase A-like enzyme